MATLTTASNARQSLRDHVATKGAEIHAKYGPQIGWKALLRILDDRACVRYPCKIAFNSGPLQPGEFAHPLAVGERPEDGFTLYVHPQFMANLDQVPLLVFYQLVLVNYGEFASSEDAETFGANAVGLSLDDYYAELVRLQLRIGGSPRPTLGGGMN